MPIFLYRELDASLFKKEINELTQLSMDESLFLINNILNLLILPANVKLHKDHALSLPKGLQTTTSHLASPTLSQKARAEELAGFFSQQQSQVHL